MPILNADIARLLDQTADLLEIKGENPFRVRAYRNAARTIESVSVSVADVVAKGSDLSEYQGIGKDLAGKIESIILTGSFETLDKAKKQIPEELVTLLKISGLGPKRVAKLYRERKINSVEKLKKALKAGKISELEGFGKKIESNIAEALERYEETKSSRFLIKTAEDIAEPLMEYLSKAKRVKKLEIAGSYRRRKDTVKDLDILAVCEDGSDMMEKFANYDNVVKVVNKGQTKSSVILRSNINVDIRVVEEDSYGAAMVYFTGSKDHNVAIRKIANGYDLKLNEYGVFEGKERVAGKSEKDVYEKLGLKYIEPELRENRGEIDAAKEGKLPKLLKREDLKGDLHVHSDYTDGKNTIEEMAIAARELGYSYIAITDHSPHLTVAGGMKPDELRKQIDEIDKINERVEGIEILKGCEIDILEDGSLDLPEDILKRLDVRVCSIHHKFGLSKREQTERLIRAMDNEYFQILGHPSGRRINERPAMEIDIDRIFKAVRERGGLLELNAHPQRLDIDDIQCKMAKEMGIKVVISTDSHNTEHLKYIKYGVWQGRRGWLEADDVANTRRLSGLKKLLKR